VRLLEKIRFGARRRERVIFNTIGVASSFSAPSSRLLSRVRQIYAVFLLRGCDAQWRFHYNIVPRLTFHASTTALMPPRRRKPPRAGALTDLPPLKIIRSIFLLQLAYYATAAILILFTTLILGQKFTPALIFSWRSVRGDTTIGWTIGFTWLLTGFITYDHEHVYSPLLISTIASYPYFSSWHGLNLSSTSPSPFTSCT
jgi:Integral membrane protein S linking to the trans Golgi network